MGLKNRYFELRHGHSLPNAVGIILSDPQAGRSPEYTLTNMGEGQVFASVTAAKDAGLLGSGTVIVSSPFSRCRRTAEIARDVLGAGEIVFDERLCERWFGDHERGTNQKYALVWERDKVDSSHTDCSVESADSVRARTVQLVEECEAKYEGKDILLVSHGDALQILQTWFHDRPASEHRELQHLETAEIRQMN